MNNTEMAGRNSKPGLTGLAVKLSHISSLFHKTGSRVQKGKIGSFFRLQNGLGFLFVQGRIPDGQVIAVITESDIFAKAVKPVTLAVLALAKCFCVMSGLIQRLDGFQNGLATAIEIGHSIGHSEFA